MIQTLVIFIRVSLNCMCIWVVFGEFIIGTKYLIGRCGRGLDGKKIRPKVVTTLLAMVVSRVACACFSLAEKASQLFFSFRLSISHSLINRKELRFIRVSLDTSQVFLK